MPHIDRIEHADRVGSWLAATARNECLRSLAARKRLVLAHEDDPFDGPARHDPKSTRRCSPPSVRRGCARP